MTTFSQRVKEEMIRVKLSCDNCKIAFAYALIYFSLKEKRDWLYQTDKQEIADALQQVLSDQLGLPTAVKGNHFTGKKGRKTVVFRITSDQEYSWYQKPYDLPLQQFIDEMPPEKCCSIAFLRGMFIACGTIVNPIKEYHLEFHLQSEQQADCVDVLLSNIEQTMHRTQRRNHHILYVKESVQIEEMLTCLGAISSVFELMNIKIEKDLRNQVNRITNCETANIQKTVDASFKQVKDIRTIIAKKGWDYLPAPLQETARLRLTYPEYSLQELCEQFSVPISRSGLSHRFKRIARLAENIP